MSAPAAARRTDPAALPPGPNFPMWLSTLLWQFRFSEFATFCHRRYGNYYTLHLPVSRDLVAVSDPEAIRTVFADRGERTHAGEGNSILEPILGRNSLLTLDGPEHTRQRRLVHPPFHGARMQGYVETIREVTNGVVDEWPVDQVFALRDSTQSLTLKVILRTVFGLVEGQRMAHVERLIQKVTAPASTPLGVLALLQRDLGPLRVWSNFLRDRELLDRALYAEIAVRRESADVAERDDILSILLLARDEAGEPMSDVELRDELMTLLLAGHETTATALAWFFDLVLHHPPVLERLVAEAATAQTIYLDAAISETLRLRPVVAMVARKLQEDMQVGQHVLPRGTVVAPNIFLTHRRADLYPDPLAFRPERFLEERVETYSWLPFGGGIRRCVGADFALMEMRVAIPEILRRVDLAAADPRMERIRRRAVTLVPAHGTRVVVRRKAPRVDPDTA
ncbi:MAG: cytochrome P450 [Candidatus Dormibacteria bacterium]